MGSLNESLSRSFQIDFNGWTKTIFKAYVSAKILNWHRLRHSHSADICIHFYCLSWLRQARQRKMIQKSALWLCLRLCQFKISWDTLALSFPLCNENLDSFLTRWGSYSRRGNYSREETIWGNTVDNIFFHYFRNDFDYWRGDKWCILFLYVTNSITSRFGMRNNIWFSKSDMEPAYFRNGREYNILLQL